MKALNLLFTQMLISFALFSGFSSIHSQPKEVPIPKPVTGLEVYDNSQNTNIINNKNYKLYIPTVRTSSATVFFSPTGVNTVYDLQSNGVAQQIWQDPLTPSNIHATFMYSVFPGFASRDCAYLFSNDFGAIWTYLGDVPNTDRSGFPAITGYTNGAAVIANHNNTNGTLTRTKLYYDAGPGFGVFTEMDPGDPPEGLAIWPRVIGIGMNKTVFAGSINGSVNSYTNTSNNGVFSGYVGYPGDQAETYGLALAPNGIVGHAYIGAGDGINDNDVFYRFSTNDGISWSSPQQIWDWDTAADSLGCLRGVSMAFGNNSEPYVAFNISLLTATGFFPTLPSSIRVWSPNINGGIPKIIANESNVPFFPNSGAVSDAFLPICRPAIGRTSSGNGMVVAFTATTGQYGSDTSAYYSVWSSYTVDGGANWIAPERLTPAVPLRDWRFVSVSPTNNVTGSECTAQMTCQSDSLAGTHVNGAPIGMGELINIRYVFPINSAPAGPTLLYPANNATNIPLTPLMDWSNVSNADSYRIQISANSNFTTTIVDQGNLTNSEFQVAASVLNYDNLYFWRVNGTNSNGTGTWSNTYNFRTINFLPAAPVLVSPLNNSTGNSLTPALDWNDISDALHYNLQVATDTGFTNMVVNQNNINVSQYNIPSSILNIGTGYYWRVNAVNANGTGPWSARWRFTTISIPAAPVLVSPANGATQVLLTPGLSWVTVSDAAGYNLNIALDSNFSTVILTAGNITNSFYNVPSALLNINTRYYWRVNAYNAIGTGQWSSSFHFTTIGPPSAPLLLTPVNNAVNVSLTPLLDWENVLNASTYRLQIATDSVFSNIILNPVNLTASQYNVPSPYFTYLTKYYWRASAANGIGASDWSSVFSFTTLNAPLPSAPTLVSPANGSTGIILTPLLSWINLVGANSYGLQISTDINFNNVIHSQQKITNISYTVPSSVLNNNTLYFWRVNASNNSGTGSWSAEWIFRTIIVGIENISSEIPAEYKLYNNYPNPFNPSTKIEFDLPEAADVEITVYDFLGRKVKDLVSQNLQAGKYRTEFDARDYSSGIYFYTYTAGKYRETGRMILIK
ncbi:MAG: T9SS type A sorting domain-containing protein [Ignavibacteria bacterium]|nr:T9SS type A sorting domain-containing protein [Ignavibacteria bacterium]